MDAPKLEILSKLENLLDYFYTYQGKEKISPIVMLNKLTQLLIDSHGDEDFDSISDTHGKDCIFSSIDDLYSDYDEREATQNYIDTINFEFIYDGSKKDLEELLDGMTEEEKYEIVLKAFKEILNEDPEFDILFYKLKNNLRKLEQKISDIISINIFQY